VGLFLILTFFLSWGFDLLVDRATGLRVFADLGMTPFGMFIPGFVALILRLFVFKDSPIHRVRFRDMPRLILLGFLLATVAYGTVTVLVVCLGGSQVGLQGLGAVLLTLWTLSVFLFMGRSDPGSIDCAGLGIGDRKTGIWFVLLAVAFFLSQSGLNLIVGFGEHQGDAGPVYGLPIPSGFRVPALAALFIPVTVIGVPLSGLAATFGEEYGWRGYLQDELMRLGRVPGALLVGAFWGLWHVPVILSGVHTYPPTSVGILLGVTFFVLWGIVQSYSVLKTGGIWVAVFLHGVVNSVYGFLITYFVRPVDILFSFGLGIFGLLSLALIVVAILRDPLWRSPS
jgi:membrane protease YdiL (CAAX protease family)